MRSLTAVSILSVLGGGAILALSVAEGDAEVGLLIIFPYVVAHGALSALGIGLIFLGFLLFFLSIARSVASYHDDTHRVSGTTAPEIRKESKVGGVVMIGPVPIVFGSDSRMARGMMLLAILLVALLIVLYSVILLF